MNDIDNFRLPRNVIPKRYEITLLPDLSELNFEGEEVISLQIQESTETIVLNCLDLEITFSYLNQQGSLDTQLQGSVQYDSEHQRIILSFDQTIQAGPWELRLGFKGVINDKLRGFYKSVFNDPQTNETKTIATTQFEATDARRAFPCWDEPDIKAIFSISLIIDEYLVAISNSPIKDEQNIGEGKKKVDFEDTILMSTYLVAFIIGPLEFSNTVNVDGVDLRVAHIPGKQSLTDFALKMGEHSLKFFSKWFEIPYPGSKLDLVAIPDFAFGAMENLGAVTFRESALLIDPNSASRAELERVADVVAHEIAHMWFGDLVTMKWWNGLWLNEAFATFMELLCVDAFNPDWKRWVSFALSRGTAMAIDGLSSTRPIEFNVVSPEDAEGMFDVLTYQKGASVIRMLERYLGEEEFRRGIVSYLDTHRYANAETTDLWDAIESVTGKPVRSTMDSWIFQGGYPMLSVKESSNSDSIELSQEPFTYKQLNQNKSWNIPIRLKINSDQNTEEIRILLDKNNTQIKVSPQTSWINANSEGWGFYRVNYSESLLSKLISNVSQLNALERFSLVSDTWASTLAGLSPLSHFTNLAKNFSQEDDPSIWKALLGPFFLLDLIADQKEIVALQKFVKSIVSPKFEQLSNQDPERESDNDKVIRSSLFNALGVLASDEQIIQQAKELALRELNQRDYLDPNLISSVLNVASYFGTEDLYDSFFERFLSPSTPQEELRYLYALAEFQDPILLQRTLDACLGPIRSQNVALVIRTALSNKSGRKLTWEFVKQNWEELTTKMPDNNVPMMLDGITSLIEPDSIKDISQFLSQHPVKSGKKSIEQTLERLEINIEFAKNNRGKLKQHLQF